MMVELRAPLHLGRGLRVSALRQVKVSKRTVEGRRCDDRRRRAPGRWAPCHGQMIPVGGPELPAPQRGVVADVHLRLRVRRRRRRGCRRCHVKQQRVDVRVLEGRPARIRGQQRAIIALRTPRRFLPTIDSSVATAPDRPTHRRRHLRPLRRGLSYLLRKPDAPAQGAPPLALGAPARIEVDRPVAALPGLVERPC